MALEKSHCEVLGVPPAERRAFQGRSVARMIHKSPVLVSSRARCQDFWLATFMEVTEERMAELIRTADVRVLVSTEEGDDDEGTIGDTIASETESIEASVTRHNTGAAVRDVLRAELSDRDQLIVRMYYYEDATFREIAQLLDVTESRVSQLHSRIKRKLQEHLLNFVAA